MIRWQYWANVAHECYSIRSSVKYFGWSTINIGLFEMGSPPKIATDLIDFSLNGAEVVSQNNEMS